MRSVCSPSAVYPKTVVGVLNLKERLAGKNVPEGLKKCWFHIVLLVSFSLPIIVLMVLDYLNLESILFSGSFTARFLFLATFKGRMFYLFFLWLLYLESVIDWDKIVERKPKNLYRIFATFVCTVIPLIYVLGVNFWGLDQTILSVGQDLGLPERYPPDGRVRALNFHWVLCVEYAVFATSFLVAALLAYKKEGLGFFSIGLSLLMGMSVIYAIDTFYPQGVFKPFEMLALPTAASAAALLDILGYNFILQFLPGPNSMPLIREVVPGPGSGRGAYIGWPCAGVHSLFLFTVIIMLFFKRSSISSLRKFIYFVVGAFGTYFVNVLRIVSIFVIMWNDGVDVFSWHLDASFFHNSVGELYFISWVFIYILMIVSIEKFMLVEKSRFSFQKLRSLLGIAKSRFLSYLKTIFKVM